MQERFSPDAYEVMAECRVRHARIQSLRAELEGEERAQSHFGAINTVVRSSFIVEGNLLNAVPPPMMSKSVVYPPDETRQSEGETRPTASKQPRDSRQPSRDRQNDILAAIEAAGTPLTRSELVEAMKLKTEGKLGAHLAWMVENGILTNIPQRGYWPADRPLPE